MDVVVAGFGSSHGDDQAGWQVIAAVRKQFDLPARLLEIREGTQLLEELDGCERLIVVDGYAGGHELGTITRITWPDPRIRQYHNHSTHGVGLCDALELAERLRLVPQDVEVFGIEIGNCRPLDGMSAEVAKSVVELTEIIVAELYETVDARTVVG
jgi:hydrogenase maturation protease